MLNLSPTRVMIFDTIEKVPFEKGKCRKGKEYKKVKRMIIVINR